MQLDKYEKRERNKVGESTLNSRMSALRNLDKFIGGGEPSVEDVEDWVDNLIDEFEAGNIKSSTIRQYLKAVKYYFSKVLGQDGDLQHITDWLPEKDVDHGAYMTEQEWETLRNSVHNIRDRAFIEVLYHYARRPTEVLLLNKEDVDFEENTIRFNILKKEKDDRGEKLPMLELKRDGEVYKQHRVFRATFELVPDIKNRLNKLIEFGTLKKETVAYNGEEKEVTPLFGADNARMSYTAALKMVKRNAERAGIEKNITLKSGRHSRATHLNWAGHSPDEIADKQLVHDPESDVIGAYVHPRDEDDVREVMSTEEKE